MKSLKIAILNLIIVAISFVAILGYFFAPLFQATVKVTFTEELASKIFTEPSNDASDEEKLTYSLITELARQKVSFKLVLTIPTDRVLNSALSSDISETKKLLTDFTDSVAEHLGKEKKDEIETAITKASVSTVVKMEIEKFSEEVGKEVEEILSDIGVDNDYVDQKTQAVLDAVKTEGATVDSVTDTVIEVIDEVYDKIENSSYADSVEALTEQEKEDLTQNVKDILSNIANEDGTINGDEVISALLSELLSQNTDDENSQTEESSAPIKFNSSSSEGGGNGSVETGANGDSELVTTLKTEFAKIITDDVCLAVKQVLTGILILLAFSSIFWLWLILKIVIKISSPNPYIKIKAPIFFGWLPFVILYALPTAFMTMLASPPAFLSSALGAETLEFISSILSGGGATFASSSIIPAICAVVLFVFGIYYVIKRRRFKKEVKFMQKRSKKSKHAK